MRVLITNDDGIAAPGIRWLAEAAVERGLDVVVAAPAAEASGTSAGMTAVEDNGRVVVEPRVLENLPDVQSYGVAGSPGFITLIAIHGAFGPPPTVVLSGVNRGANAGRAILHSGTVGAAFTAAANGCRAMAVSLDVLSATSATAGSGGAAVAEADLVSDDSRHWSTAARVALDMLPRLTSAPLECVLNVNSPDIPYEQLRGVRRGTLSGFGQVQMTVAEAGHGYIQTALEESGQPVEPGTDVAWLAQGYASVSAVRAIAEAYDVDLSELERSAGGPADRNDQTPGTGASDAVPAPE